MATPTYTFVLNDTFNHRMLSQHKTFTAAVKADIAHNRAVKRANGSESYIPTEIREWKTDLHGWISVDRSEVALEAEHQRAKQRGW